MSERCCPCCGLPLEPLARHGRQRDCIGALRARVATLEALLRDCYPLFATHSWGAELAVRIGEVFGLERPKVEARNDD